MKSKVYFTDLHTTPAMNLPAKLEQLIRRAGIERLDCEDKFTAVKIHFGEPGNLAYLRHNYAARVVAVLHSLDARVFLTDANTLYSGQRSNAIQHLKAAFEHGYNMLGVPAPIIIADGLKGLDYREVPVNSAICKTAKIASAIADADVIVSLSHFKGHEQAGFGGTIKNIGMGAAARRGKLELHSSSKPRIAQKHCVGCGQCVKDCNYGAVVLKSKTNYNPFVLNVVTAEGLMNEQERAVINYDLCVGCGQCIAVCRYGAAQPEWNNASEIMNKLIAEYAKAVLQNKPHFHVNFIMDVSPECDCWGSNDVPIVPDIGIAASFDPVALDMACADLVKAAPAAVGSIINKEGKADLTGKDKFICLHPNTDWRTGLEHAEKIGLGTMNYELIKVGNK